MGKIRVLFIDYIKPFFKPSKLGIAKEKHGKIVDVLDKMRDDQRRGAFGTCATPIQDEFVLLFCERKGYCKYLFTGGNFERILTPKGIEILEYMNYDSYLRAKWWKKVWDRISIPISVFAICVSAYVGWFKPSKDTFKDYGEPRVTQLETKIGQLSNDLNSLKTHPQQVAPQVIFYVDSSNLKKGKN